ncbi:pentapeptide repeat-containing protein [Sphaerisporangium rubeum]|uniref:Uncharacterized protein YjbI with pentapeptide repeats n=1 Tax=Sphaerisporangium rubeum TaxID=321317 RepID=A0A7X0MA65_9ACTN|nr:pentapeptide repeat-containing protein [Sphaerisporangium rubeum]MBB6475759.1 uncharacterized protein YjbI with pentapeptide repeats [Sphaerisporangium rubeum]
MAVREFDDLPYARYLEDFSGPLTREGDYDTVHVRDVEFGDVDAGNGRFLESALTSVTFEAGRYRRTRFNDVWMRSVRWVGSDLGETEWLHTDVDGGALSGVRLDGALLRQVVFQGCKFDSVNFRAAKLREVTFTGCVLRAADFAEATLTDVTFDDCVLNETRLGRAELKNVDLRGARELGLTDGVASLRGATITRLQLLDLAPAMADLLGITVDKH